MRLIIFVMLTPAVIIGLFTLGALAFVLIVISILILGLVLGLSGALGIEPISVFDGLVLVLLIRLPIHHKFRRRRLLRERCIAALEQQIPFLRDGVNKEDRRYLAWLEWNDRFKFRGHDYD